MSILSINGPDKKIASLEKQWRQYCKRNGLDMVIRKSKADITKEEDELKRQLKLVADIKEAKRNAIESEAKEAVEKKKKEAEKIAKAAKAKADLRAKQEEDRQLAEKAKAQKKVDLANEAEEQELEKVRKNLEKIKQEESKAKTG